MANEIGEHTKKEDEFSEEHLKNLRDAVIERRYQAEDITVSLETELEESTVKITYLKSQIEQSIKRYKAKRRFNAQLSVVVKFLALVLSALVTILLGLDATSYSQVALVISALISVVGGVAAYFDFTDLALKFKETVDKLETLQVRLHYMMEGNTYIRMNEVEFMMNDYLYILESTQDFFQRVRKSDEKKKS